MTAADGRDDDYACRRFRAPECRKALDVGFRSNRESPTPMCVPWFASRALQSQDHVARPMSHNCGGIRDCDGGTPAQSLQDHATRTGSHIPARWTCRAPLLRHGHYLSLLLAVRPRSEDAGPPKMVLSLAALPIPSDCFTNHSRRTVTGVRLRGSVPPDIMHVEPSNGSAVQPGRGSIRASTGGEQSDATSLYPSGCRAGYAPPVIPHAFYSGGRANASVPLDNSDWLRIRTADRQGRRHHAR